MRAMRSVEFEYGGFIWRRYPEAKRRCDRVYYKRMQKDGKPIWLHRYVWEQANGAIPSRYVIHHKDGNPENNALDNLECLSPKEHSRKHPLTGEGYEKQRQHLDQVRYLTKAWHASEEGRAKHREIGGLAYKNFIPQEKFCKQCGKSFLPKALGNRDLFCSNACKSAWRREQHLDEVECVCKWCGKKFMHNKFKIPNTCSRSCANHLMWENRRKGL